jgi:hypothetical protein
MSPVAFDHKAHEGYTDNCHGCHHADLTYCARCHTPEGNEEGKQVTLTQAMHQVDAAASCAGCHRIQQSKAECAGCHHQDRTRPILTEDTSCRVCHLPMDGQPVDRSDDAAANAMAARLLEGRPSAPDPVPTEQIPESVTIKQLSNEYGPVVFPHRQIVLKLAEKIEKNRLAGYFHRESTTLCQGCHHNSPAALKPPQCGYCHSRTSEVLNSSRPGLLAAYHQQCIQCHEQMGIEKPASRQCTACHEKRST